MQEAALDGVTDAVLLASRALVAVAARSLAAAANDVTLPQFRVLVVLAGGEPRGMSELADELGCSPSTATRLCDRLVRKGLMVRGHPASNRREVEVDVTAAGRRLVNRVTKRRRDEIARIVSHVPEAQRTAMVKALHSFAAAAGETPDQAWTSGWDL